MPETARILRFPARGGASSLTPAQAEQFALRYLATKTEHRDEKTSSSVASNAEILTSLCKLLRGQRDSNPQKVAEESSAVYELIRSSSQPVGVFDERDYFLGETAYLSGSSLRLIGRREEALRWLDRSEAAFRHTVNPGPGLASIAYARLALRFEMGEYDDVLELLPSVRTSFKKLGMDLDLAKASLLEAATLKQCGRSAEALAILADARTRPGLARDSALRARVLAEIGDLHQTEGRFEEAMVAYQEALPLLEVGGTSVALADLRMFVGSAYRTHGQLDLALNALMSAVTAYAELGMITRVAYTRLFVADTLLGLGRHREAEWQILAALPAIEEQKMVPEGFAAAALLKESIRQRKTDANALRELREHLQGK